MDPNIWGPPFWFSLHSITFTYPFHPDEEEKARVRNFFHSLPYVLPCKICRVHYSEHLRDHPIENSLDSRADLVKWLIDVHNTVNQMLGKRTYSLEEVLQFYEEKHGHPIILHPHTTELLELSMEQEQEQCGHGQQEPKQKQIDSKNNYNRENIILFFGMLSVILLFLLSKRSKLLKKSFFSF